jgi:Mg-chelatase subunit ChlD
MAVTRNRGCAKRQPTTEESAAAFHLADRLREVAVPNVDEYEVWSDEPPGSIDMVEAMLWQAQREIGVQPTARMFVDYEREVGIETPITVGIMCDVSGSMGNAQEPLGVARWILTEAITQNNGRIAAVLFDERAHGIQPPGTLVHEVEVYSATGGFENYTEGFSMLDGALDIIDGEGARLLVVITDGHFNKDWAVEYAEQTMDMCRVAGVGVVWLSVSGYFARDDCYGHGSLVDASKMAPVDVANALGDAIIEEFRKAAPAHGVRYG